MPAPSGRLATALAGIPGCPPEMIACARNGYYTDQRRSPLPAPGVQLVTDLLTLARAVPVPASRQQLRDLAKAVIDGAFADNYRAPPPPLPPGKGQ